MTIDYEIRIIERPIKNSPAQTELPDQQQTEDQMIPRDKCQLHRRAELIAFFALQKAAK